MTAVDLEPQIMIDELLIRGAEAEALGQSLQFHHIKQEKSPQLENYSKAREIGGAINP